ncbi:MAG: hypothetical protein JW702_09115 [Clostridiales bacterium]|nr:hypothetical protein [Clostridiales bacterium]
MNKDTTIELGPEIEFVKIRIQRDPFDGAFYRRYLQHLCSWLDHEILGLHDKMNYVAIPVRLIENRIHEIKEILQKDFLEGGNNAGNQG